jgi:hypothetical protein
MKRRVRRQGADEASKPLVSSDHDDQHGAQQAILELKGTGRGLWGRASTETIHKLRDEWNR